MSCIRKQSPNMGHSSPRLDETVGRVPIPMESSWYTPTAIPSCGPYMTPLTSSTFESGPSITSGTSLWGGLDQAVGPNPVPGFDFMSQSLQSTTIVPLSQHHTKASPLPASSQSINWNDNALGISFDGQHQLDAPFPPYSNSIAFGSPPSTTPYITGTPLHNIAARDFQASGTSYSTPPDSLYPCPSPNPVNLAAKRRLEQQPNVELAVAPAGKRRRRTNSGPGQMTEEERLLLHLRETEQLQWKDIASRFTAVNGEARAVPTWQMQYHRLRKRLLEEKSWAKRDVAALQKAHEWYETKKWELITHKMLEQDVTEKWTSDIVARKWQELQQTPATTLPIPTLQLGQITPYASPRNSGDHGYGRMSM